MCIETLCSSILIMFLYILSNIYTLKNEVCKAHQIVSIHTLIGKKCAYRDILVCMAHFSIYGVYFSFLVDFIPTILVL